MSIKINGYKIVPNLHIFLSERRSPLAEAMIIDGHALAFRAFFGCSFPPSSPSGVPVNALYGFGSILVSFLERWDPDMVSFVFDSPGPKFRNEMYSEYKANRPKAPEDFIVQLPLIIDFIKCLGFPVLSIGGIEADDVIASLAISLSNDGNRVRIMSPDKDFCQILDEGDIVLTRPPAGKYCDYRDVDAPSFRSEFGFAPPLMVDYLALLGDRADNVPGVRGIGKKGALKLVQDHGGIEQIYENLSSLTLPVRTRLEQGRDSAFLSRDLIRLKTGVDIQERPCTPCNCDRDRLKEFCSENNVYRLYERCVNSSMKHSIEKIEEEVLYI